jgi:hypothetical protein
MSMEYLFTATGNPAYRFFTIKFFTEGGIEFVDQYMGVERAHAIFRQLSPKKSKNRAEEIFCECLGPQSQSSQGLLASIGMLEKIYGKLDASKMRELESLLPVQDGLKLVFTRQEVAKRLSDFYTGALRDLLRKDLEDGSASALSKHIQLRDDDQLPSYNPVDRYDEAVRAFVETLLLWTNQITPENVSQDIEIVLTEHEKTPFSSHSGRLSLGRGRGYYLWCEHRSKYVVLEGHPHDGMIRLTLKASREPIYDELDSGPFTMSPFYVVEPDHGSYAHAFCGF